MGTKIITLIIIYFIALTLINAQTTVALRLGTQTGMDAYVTDYYPDLNFRTDRDLVGWAWTVGGISVLGRTYFKFNLSFIPSNSVISDARLSLYGNPSPTRGPGHSTWSGSNASYIRKVINIWNDSTLTWNNKPPSSSGNQVILPQSTSSMQDYLNIDVTTLVRDMIANPSTNYGFILQLQTEQYYRSLNFASSDCSDSTKRPKLVITYSPVGINPISTEIVNNFSLYQNYPNPFNPSTKIQFDIPVPNLRKSRELISLRIYNLLGSELNTLVNEPLGPGKYEIEWDASNYSGGIYYYTLRAGEYSETKKMILVK